MSASVFDIIFAGGGTTACVVAGRLAAADPSLKILIVESGQHSRDVAQHVQPCRYIENLAPTSTTVSFHVGKVSPHLNDRAPIVPCGRAVGGGSAVNFMLYVRGAASDYDDWHALGNEGWSFDELLPYIRKVETFMPISDGPTHGYSGPVKVSTGGANLEIGKQILGVAKEYDPDRQQVDDSNDFKTPNAYSPAHKYIDPVTGRRCDAASRYLYPNAENPNLTILVGKQVKRVVIEGGRAVGIEYTTARVSGELVTALAHKLVVVSAGAFGSPSILERSGVGATSVLDENKIPVLVDLPGVGKNYQDHLGNCPGFYASNDTETMDDLWTDAQSIAGESLLDCVKSKLDVKSTLLLVCLPEWEKTGTGKIAHNAIEAIMKLRPTSTQLLSAGPALQSRWKTFFQNKPDKALGMIVPFSAFPLDPGHSALVGRKVFSAIYYLVRKHGPYKFIPPSHVLEWKMYPDLNGSVHIKSGEDANAPLEFDPDYCSKPGDVEQLTLLYKMSRELARRIPAYRGEVAAYHPKFPPGSPAACKETDMPVPADAPDIVYSDADDKTIEKFTRDTVNTTWHSLGTCAMKPRDQGGVVDPRLNVYGVQGLKVADLSICPTNVGNNTYSTALLVGEKAAAIIAEDLKIALEGLSML